MTDYPGNVGNEYVVRVVAEEMQGSDLTHQWSQRFGDASTQYAWSAALDDFGNVLVTGDIFGTVDFGDRACPQKL